MQNHPEHDHGVPTERWHRRLLLAAGVLLIAVVLVVLHLSGVIGGSHA